LGPCRKVNCISVTNTYPNTNADTYANTDANSNTDTDSKRDTNTYACDWRYCLG
jgi:hypothetical protein